MKNLISILVFVSISFPSFTQIITIDVYETQPYVRWEKTDGKKVVESPEWNGYKEPANGTYILDIENKTIQHFHNGTLMSNDTIQKLVIEGDHIHIEFFGETEVPEIKFEGQFDFNQITNESSLTWYNYFGQYTRTQLNTKSRVKVTLTKKIS